MKKIVISGSSSLRDKIDYWLEHLSKDYEILDYPRYIEPGKYIEELPDTYKRFYNSIENTDVLFVMNEDKNGIEGYIGASAIAELTYAVIQNLIHNKNIEIYTLKMPSKDVPSYDEVKFWLDIGWIKIWED